MKSATSPVAGYTPPARPLPARAVPAEPIPWEQTARPPGPKATERGRRAYVVTIGVNAYDIPGKSLRFAVDDAQAMARALATIPGYDDVVPVPLIGERETHHATKADIRAVLALLAGDERGNRARLAAAGIDARGLRRATPDDLVILSFSGHGYADPDGAFFLLPSDAQQSEDADAPTLSTLVSSEELTGWMRGIDAGEMAIVIDACHSAASVAAGGFRPGPMGDPGLGQLAFDKQIRILAATQADDVALEDGALDQGLLTYALVHDGLGAGLAQQDGEGHVRLDRLLKYAVRRLPSLDRETRARRLAAAATGPLLVSRIPLRAPPSRTQQPVLFDFKGWQSEVGLPGGPRAVRLAATACLALIVGAAPLSGSAATRALFVGIDRYTYSYKADPKLRRDPDAEADFLDLKGAVADVVVIKQVLAKTYGLEVDPGPPQSTKTASASPCETGNAVSTTLIDACATRAAILARFEALIGQSAPGDIVLFYFAGHGSSHAARAQDQPGSDNSTLVPSDARRPPVSDHNDILDVELKQRIDQAAARGVSVVTIFDSCHSGTATRDIATNRSAPIPKSGPAPIVVAPPPLAAIAFAPTIHPYQVHLAAAGDREEAHETTRDGVRHGIFTLALTDTLTQRKGATYLDIARETRLRLEQSGHAPQLRLGTVLGTTVQNSQAEGALGAPFLGADPGAARAYPARVTGARALSIEGGTLSGVTQGSSFAVFASSTEAAKGETAVLARGVVTAADAASALLTLSAPLASDRVGQPAFVVEQAHNYGPARLKVRIDGGEAADRARVRRELSALGGDKGAVVLTEGDAQFVIALAGGAATFKDADGRAIVSAGRVEDAAFARRLADVTRAAANYFALLGLRNDNGARWGKLELYPGGCTEGEGCGAPATGDPLAVKVGDVDLMITNVSTRKLYRYALFLNSDTYEISILSPPAYSDDPPLTPGQQLIVFEGRFQRLGRGVVLVLLTERPINIGALRQDPVRDIGAAPRSDLERLLLDAGAGARGDQVVRAGDWGALATPVIVTN